MSAASRTFAFGALKATTDTWLIITGSDLIFLDLSFDPSAWEHKTVGIVGMMGI